MRPRIEITGIREFQKSLRQMDAELAKGLRVVFNRSAQLIIDNAQRRIPRKSGRAATSLKLRSSQREARIAAGGKQAPYYPWLDFGGRVGPADSVVRRFITEGRYIYPQLREHHDDIQDVMSQGLTDLAAGAGLEVT